MYIERRDWSEKVHAITEQQFASTRNNKTKPSTAANKRTFENKPNTGPSKPSIFARTDSTRNNGTAEQEIVHDDATDNQNKITATKY